MFPALHTALADLNIDDRNLYCSAIPTELASGALSQRAIDRLGFQAQHPWLARHFAEQAVREAIGAAALHTVASRLPAGSVRDLVTQHAIDEGRHQKIFWKLSGLHGGVDSDAIKTLKARREDETNKILRHTKFSFPRFITDTHVSEVNSLHHLTFTRSALPPNGELHPVRKALASLIADEMHHVLYTARLCTQFIRINPSHQNYFSRSTQYFFKELHE